MFTPTVAYLGSGSQQHQQPWNPPPLYAVGSSESQQHRQPKMILKVTPLKGLSLLLEVAIREKPMSSFNLHNQKQDGQLQDTHPKVRRHALKKNRRR